jgi:DNA-binding response OmpR family regulator
MSARVLIAEDEPSIVASLDFLMRQCGYETMSVRDGDAAIACLDEFRPHLVLLDVMLPLKSGFEVCRHIRASGHLAGMRVLILTAQGSAADEAVSRGAGADDYLAKPFATRELVARARALIGDAP